MQDNVRSKTVYSLILTSSDSSLNSKRNSPITEKMR